MQRVMLVPKHGVSLSSSVRIVWGLCGPFLSAWLLRYWIEAMVNHDPIVSKQGSKSMGQERFESAYQEKAPWDISGPQSAFVGLEESGAIIGSVLDVGCGTGENALYLASRGHEVWGLDFVPVAIERATAKAHQRGLSVHFQVGDARKLDQLGRTFDTVIDCGLLHTFTDDERPLYVAGLSKVVRHGGCVQILCFSEQEPPGQGPRRVTQREIRDAFRDGWEVVEIREARFQTTDHPIALTFTPGGPKAWLATIRRAES